jgi:hypothetical protein
MVVMKLLILCTYAINTTYTYSFCLYTRHMSYNLWISLFSSLKSHYQTAVGLLALLTDSSLIGKQNVLACYYKARNEALSAKIIKAR